MRDPIIKVFRGLSGILENVAKVGDKIFEQPAARITKLSIEPRKIFSKLPNQIINLNSEVTAIDAMEVSELCKPRFPWRAGGIPPFQKAPTAMICMSALEC